MIGTFKLPISAGGSAPVEITPYVRPLDWLEIDSLVTEGTEKFVGLHLINETNNFVALSVTGAYTVNWGDGVTENISSGNQANHTYNWADFAGTETSEGFRQAIVTVTPQVAGTFTNINTNRKHNQSGLNTYSTGWLDIVMSAPNMTSISIGGSTIKQGSLKKFVFKGTNVITSMSAMFVGCTNLESVNLFHTASCTSMSQMFNNCYLLETVPLFNTAACTSMANMFTGCYNLKEVPLFDTAIVTSMSAMFQNCYSLETVPLFNTASCTSMANMFTTCYNLKEVPLFDTSLVTSMNSMFSNCVVLESVPLFNTVLVQNMASMFNNCNALETVPLFNTVACTGMGSMFSGCYNLKEVPLFNTAIVTSIASMFSNCNRLLKIPLFNTAIVTNMSTIFSGCGSLREIPLLNVSAVTTGNFSLTFNGCTSLEKGALSGTKITISYSSCKLSAPELVAIFNGLATVTGMTITISSNWGAGLLTAGERAIATDKGWTIVG